MQFLFFIHLVRYLEYSQLGIGIRLDYVLDPYYQKDLKEHRITKDEALEILQLLWIKFIELGMVYSPLLTSVYGGVASLQSLTLGGTDKEGRDITNELTYLALEAAKMIRAIEPSISLRIHNGTPDELLSKAVDLIKTGIGYPSLFNDEALIPLLEKWGVPPEDAKGYATSGCVYMEIPGKNITRSPVGYLVLTKCLWWSLRQGVDPKTGEQWGARTPDPATFKSWENVFEAYLEQVKFFLTKIVQLENTCRGLHAKYCPRPFYSAIVEGCIERGKETKQWAYPSMVRNHLPVVGSTNVADSLAAIKKVVFEDKLVTLPKLIRNYGQKLGRTGGY